MSFDGTQIANFTLDFSDSKCRPITHLSLHKIVYFCHVWSLIELNKPLVKQNFEAWKYGPVLQHLYREFEDFGNKAITHRATKLNLLTGVREVVNCDFDVNTENYLKGILDIYTKLTATELVDLAHIEYGPWYQVWNHPNSTNPGMIIDNTTIIKFYSSGLGLTRH